MISLETNKRLSRPVAFYLSPQPQRTTNTEMTNAPGLICWLFLITSTPLLIENRLVVSVSGAYFET
jgi:hypothetical protein